MTVSAEARPESWDCSGLLAHTEKVATFIKNTIGITVWSASIPRPIRWNVCSARPDEFTIRRPKANSCLCEERESLTENRMRGPWPSEVRRVRLLSRIREPDPDRRGRSHCAVQYSGTMDCPSLRLAMTISEKADRWNPPPTSSSLPRWSSAPSTARSGWSAASA